MYILLEEGMIINYGDECLDQGTLIWDDMNTSGFIGFNAPYRKDHLPMRRKINTIEELIISYNTQKAQSVKKPD